MSTPDIDSTSNLRPVTGAQTMRALFHSVRPALIESLTLDGPLTATEASERLGESPTTCSFHLRLLASHGFVEGAGGGPASWHPLPPSSSGSGGSGRPVSTGERSWPHRAHPQDRSPVSARSGPRGGRLECQYELWQKGDGRDPFGRGAGG